MIPRTPLILQGDVALLKFKSSTTTVQEANRYGEVHNCALVGL
jgi:hypothetical protein